MTRPRLAAALAACLFVGCIVAANAMTQRWGLTHLGPLTVPAGTIAAGLCLLARDAVQDTAGRRWVLALILAGAALSGWLSTAQLAIASGVAFAVSELADMAIYTPLRRRSWWAAALASNTVGAGVDSVIFLWLAPFPLTTTAVTSQVAVKVVATAVVVGAWVVTRRALPRHTLRASRA